MSDKQTPVESARIVLLVLSDRIVRERLELITRTADHAKKRTEVDTYNQMYRQYNPDDTVGWGGETNLKKYDDKYDLERINVAQTNLNAVDEARIFLMEELLKQYVK